MKNSHNNTTASMSDGDETETETGNNSDNSTGSGAHNKEKAARVGRGMQWKQLYTRDAPREGMVMVIIIITTTITNISSHSL